MSTLETRRDMPSSFPSSPGDRRDRDFDLPASTATHTDEVEPPPPPPRTRPTVVMTFVLLTAAVAAAAYVQGWQPRALQKAALAQGIAAAATAKPRVQVVVPRAMPESDTLVLPGDVRAMDEVEIFPRANGYLKRRHVDLGDHVTAGQLLAEIDSPEVDAQVEQAQATLTESEAALDSARATARLNESIVVRSRMLHGTDSIPQQELEEAEAALAVSLARVRLAEATIQVNQANLRRAQELQSFSQITAPFEGTVVGRSVEQGQLVTAGNNSGQSLLRIAKTNPLRVFVNVPQAYAANVRQGQQATIVVRHNPGRPFTGIVARTAGAIDLQTRTLLTELQVSNDDGALLAGSYVQVTLEVKHDNPPLLIPASSLVINSDGTRVAVVDAERRVRFREVNVERDFGPDLGVTAGLLPTDLVVTNPGDRLHEATEVEVVE